MHNLDIISQQNAENGVASGTIQKVIPDSGNGYCKMPDGTLICWNRVSTGSGYSINSAWGSLYESNNYVSLGSWAHAFTSTPVVLIQVDAIAGWTEKAQNVTATSAGETKIVWATAGTGNFGINVIGIGRWK